MADDRKTELATGGANAPVPTRRVGVIEFFRQVDRERKKATWPTFKETWLTTILGFIMVGLTMVFFAVVDGVLNYGEMLLIGARSLF